MRDAASFASKPLTAASPPAPRCAPADAPFWQRSLSGSGHSNGSSATAPLLGANGGATSSYKVV